METLLKPGPPVEMLTWCEAPLTETVIDPWSWPDICTVNLFAADLPIDIAFKTEIPLAPMAAQPAAFVGEVALHIDLVTWRLAADRERQLACLPISGCKFRGRRGARCFRRYT